MNESCLKLLKLYEKRVREGFFFLMLLLLFMVPINAHAQAGAIEVSGVVKDEQGETLIGATVMVKGSTNGTITDIDGNFTLNVPSQKSILVFSYLGYEPHNVTVGTKKNINVTLHPQVTDLDEVVVIGYGTVKKKDLTGAVTSFKNTDVTIAPTSNVMEALQGKVAGMDIMKTSGAVGSEVNIVLRGTRSIYGDNTPLFIIDGVPGDYNQINPSDIETIDVLKDASSTAIYGSKGANGVIMITTKSGSVGKARVNFDAYFSFSGKPEFKYGMIGDEWTDYQREAYKYKNGQYPTDMSSILTDAGKLDAFNQGKWIDWVDEAAGNTATNQKYNLSVTAGSEKTKIFASLSYDHQEGLLKNEDSDRYAIRLNIDQDLFSWAKVGFVSNLTYSKMNMGNIKTFTRSISAFPLGDVYNADGELNFEYAKDEYTPLGDRIKNQYVNNKRHTYINPSAYLELTPLKGLTFKSLISASLSDSRTGQFWGAEATALRPSYAGSPHAEILKPMNYDYMWENILSYSKTFANDHTLSGTFVTSWSHKEYEYSLAGASGQFLDSWSFYRLLAGTSARVESGYTQKQSMSYAFRVNYSYKSKYLLTVSNRWDGVSWFSPGHKWDAFPAGAFAWRISEESFLKDNVDWLDNLKLRIGYGVTGNSGGVDAYGTTTAAAAYSSAGITLNNKISPFTQYAGTYGSRDLGWEKSYNLNIGLDIAILRNRIDASIEWFDTRTKDLLFKRTLPVTSGITGWGKPLQRWENIAETSNQGVEVSINSRNIDNSNFGWNTSLSFTWSRDKIESLPSGDLINENLFQGRALKSFYDYDYKGIWGSDTPVEILNAYGVKPGWIMLNTNPMYDSQGNSDNGQHKYSEEDKRILGHENPDFIVGLNNSFRYKGFDLSVFVMGRYGQTIRSGLIGWYNAKAYEDDGKNQMRGADYWTESNQNAYFPVPGSGPEQGGVMNSLQYRDGSFVKIKNITLGYSLPQKALRFLQLEKLRFYGTAYNPFLFVKDKQLKGTDPENNGSDSFPLYKQFVLGVNVTF